MKKILITGANSYIGTSFEKYINDNYLNDFTIDTIDMIDGTWRDKDFSCYDSVFHVAGIAHQKETKNNAELYYKVNRDLAIETAQKAKGEGVKQFVFLSSMSVYGMDTGIINKDTVPRPKTHYGKSKLQAENEIHQLQARDFKVVIIRPPMVYGQNCKGNYNSLVKIALKSPVFPKIENQRSMIYFENLCEFIRLMIVNEESGIFYPQNDEYSNTSELVKLIAEAHGKNIFLIKGFGWLLKLISNCTRMVNKAFGNLTYEMSLSEYMNDYRKFNLKNSIDRTEM